MCLMTKTELATPKNQGNRRGLSPAFPQICTHPLPLPLIPLNRLGNTFRESHYGFPAEKSFRLRDVGLTVEDVAGARRVELRLHVLTENLVHGSDEIQERDAAAAGDVEGLTECLFRCFTGEQVGVDDILDMGEIARLAAITKDGRRFVAQNGRDESRDDRRILRLWMLTRAEDVEVAE